MWELVKAGGLLMVPLMLCSIFTVALCIERTLRLRRKLIVPDVLILPNSHALASVVSHLQHDAAALNSPLGQILHAGLDNEEHGENFARAQMEATASKQIVRLEQNINFIGTISAVAPLLGLLGTVWGIIESFLTLDMGSTANPSLMIPGISKALITTAVGMVIAIPALVAYRHFQRRVQEYVAQFEQQATLFHAALFHHKDSVHHPKHQNRS